MAYNAAKNPARFGWYTLFACLASIMFVIGVHIISPIQIKTSSTNPNVKDFLERFSAIVSSSTLHYFLISFNVITFISSVFGVMGLKERSSSYFVPFFVLVIIGIFYLFFYDYYMTDFICNAIFYSTKPEAYGLEYFGRGVIFVVIYILMAGFTSSAYHYIMADGVCEEFKKIRAEEKASKASIIEDA